MLDRVVCAGCKRISFGSECLNLHADKSLYHAALIERSGGGSKKTAEDLRKSNSAIAQPSQLNSVREIYSLVTIVFSCSGPGSGQNILV